MSELQEFGARVVDLPGGQRGLRAGITVKASVPEDGQGAMVDFRSSDETLDRYNEIIQASGWKLENYKRNPVVQNAHNYWSITDTIGKSTVTEVRGDHLYQRVKFATEENPVAKIAYALYKGGFLNAVSVGFIPLKWENGGEKAGFRRKYIEQELLEVSAVSIPANPNALTLAVKAGVVERSDLRELAQFLKHFCNEAGSRSHAGSSGPGTHDERLRVLAADVAGVVKQLQLK
jgi:HK97 family phage prohead protease